MRSEGLRPVGLKVGRVWVLGGVFGAELAEHFRLEVRCIKLPIVDKLGISDHLSSRYPDGLICWIYELGEESVVPDVGTSARGPIAGPVV